MSSIEYSNEERAQLIALAYRSIEYGFEHGAALYAEPTTYPPHLRQLRACFVTLRRQGELRGCTGSIVARTALVACVADHAFTSAFRDSRFQPLEPEELGDLDVSISVLSEPEAIVCNDEEELLARLRPRIDGVILEDGSFLATLLPSVWATLPTPELFLRQLKRKAGLPPGYWSDTIRFARYTTEEFS